MTRAVTGVGVPQFSAVLSPLRPAAKAMSPVLPTAASGFPATLPIGCCGADCVMIGSLLAGTEESPGEVFLYQGHVQNIPRQGSLGDGAGSADRYFSRKCDSRNLSRRDRGRVLHGNIPPALCCISLSAVCARRWVIPATAPSLTCNETALSGGPRQRALEKDMSTTCRSCEKPPTTGRRNSPMVEITTEISYVRPSPRMRRRSHESM